MGKKYLMGGGRAGRAAARLGLCGIVLLLAVGQPRPAAAAVALPEGFTDELVVEQREPTGLAFTPDGRLLVTTKGGELRVYAAGTFDPEGIAISLSSKICWNEERGLLGLAVDPNFASNHYIYMYYTFKKHGECPGGETTNPKNPVNRVSRFVLGDDNKATGETVLIDNIGSVDGDHNGGGLGFGPDGYLYASAGDNECHYATDQCGAANMAAREGNNLVGKILRITRDGGIPPGNPYTGGDSDRCHVSGTTSAGRWCQEVYAWGLRNPFRFAFDPNAAGTRLFINDVGANEYDEIDVGQAGGDYGWPCREGRAPYSSVGLCDPPPAGMLEPLYDYSHDTGCSSITGGAFVPNGVWPAEYAGDYLFADYVCGKIFQLDEAGGVDVTEFASGMGNSSATVMLFGPYRGTQALYYGTFANGGEVRRIAYTQGPVAALEADPTSGPVPLQVNFDGSASTDPAGGSLTYDWTFGDGASLLGQSSPTTAHTYTSAGVFTATLVVRNAGGEASSPASARIVPGGTPPTPAITLPAEGALFSVGETVQLQGSATDAVEGTLPPSALSWEVRLHHLDAQNPGNAHWHPHASATGATGSFSAPAPEDLRATALSYVEVRLTATNSAGLSATASRSLQPRRVDVHFETQPPGLRVLVNGELLYTPHTAVMWPGWDVELSTFVDQLDSLGNPWTFASWSDGGAMTHAITAPTAPVTYTARFAVGDFDVLRLFLPLMGRGL